MTPDLHLTQGTGAYMAGLPDASVPLIVTGPPYFPSDVEGQLRAGRLDADALDGLAVQIQSFAWTLRPVFDECWRVLIPGGRMVVQTRDVRLGPMLVPVEGLHRQMLEATGMRLYTRHLWRPKHTTFARNRKAASLSSELGPAPFDPEVFLVLCKPGEVRPGEPSPEDVELLERDIISTSPGRLPSGHRFQSPVPVLQALIRAHSRAGDLVVDPFSGGGTILLVARQLGRSAWGCDVDPQALDIARVNLGLRPKPST